MSARKQIPLRLPPELATAVDEYAQARKLGRNAAIVAILSNVLTPDLASEPPDTEAKPRTWADIEDAGIGPEPRSIAITEIIQEALVEPVDERFVGNFSRQAQPKTTKQKGK